MGRVLTDVTIQNLQDVWAARTGLIAPSEIRRVEVKDALVDTRATTVALPTRLIQQLDLKKSHEKKATSRTGVTTVGIYDVVRLRVLDRDCSLEVMEVPDDAPVLIGHVPLGMLDLVIDPLGRRLTGNPAHGGEHVLELY